MSMRAERPAPALDRPCPSVAASVFGSAARRDSHSRIPIRAPPATPPPSVAPSVFSSAARRVSRSRIPIRALEVELLPRLPPGVGAGDDRAVVDPLDPGPEAQAVGLLRVLEL